MAITKLKKIQLIATKSKKQKILGIIQDFGQFQVNAIEENAAPVFTDDMQKLQQIDLDYANTEFAIKTLTPHEEKKGFLPDPVTLTEKELEEKAQKIDFAPIVEACQKEGDITSNANNQIANIKSELAIYDIWKDLPIALENLSGSESSKVIMGIVKTSNLNELLEKLHDISSLLNIEVIHSDKSESAISIVFNREFDKQVKETISDFKFNEVEMPKAEGKMSDYIKNLHSELKNAEKTLEKSEQELKKLAFRLDNLKIAHDYLSWQKEYLETNQRLAHTEKAFAVQGWIPAKKIDDLQKALSNETKEFAIEEIQPEEGEKIPSIIRNSRAMSPFETLTQMYGLPHYKEVDPTPFLSVFFIVFFALCLTDAGYGIVMFAMMALALRFVKMGTGAKKLVRLLMYGGLVTAVIGALFGGWFGFLAEEVPAWMTYTNAAGETMFRFQIVNSVTSPLTVLILALALGYAQILFGIFIKFVHDFRHGDKKEALLDTGTWAFMLSGIAVFILGAADVGPSIIATIGQYWVYLGALILILTQGRASKGIIGKLMNGILSLYGLVGYMSDVLSYSRLLALGLATTIIGLAVNVIVNLFVGIPYIGWLIAAVIFIGGHAFNLVINALGSFIHAGRLQFVEFFGKFIEGGGKEFKPFSKKSKYIFIKNN